jgi:arsenate reductase
MAEVTIYHNPNCSTSRKTLDLLRAKGVAPKIVEYLKTPPDRPTLERLLAGLGMRPSQLLRRKGGLVAELGLDRDSVTEEAILAAMLLHPVLIERPIVVSGKGVRLGRPPEAVLAILG